MDNWLDKVFEIFKSSDKGGDKTFELVNETWLQKGEEEKVGLGSGGTTIKTEEENTSHKI